MTKPHVKRSAIYQDTPKPNQANLHKTHNNAKTPKFAHMSMSNSGRQMRRHSKRAGHGWWLSRDSAVRTWGMASNSTVTGSSGCESAASSVSAPATVTSLPGAAQKTAQQ